MNNADKSVVSLEETINKMDANLKSTQSRGEVNPILANESIVGVVALVNDAASKNPDIAKDESDYLTVCKNPKVCEIPLTEDSVRYIDQSIDYLIQLSEQMYKEANIEQQNPNVVAEAYLNSQAQKHINEETVGGRTI